MLFANFIRAKAVIPEKSLTIWRQDGNGMSGSKTGAEPDSEVGVVLGQAEFAADVTADYVVALLLEIVADILAFEPEDIEAAIADLPIRQAVGLQLGHESGMAVTEEHHRGTQEIILIRDQAVKLSLRCPVE